MPSHTTHHTPALRFPGYTGVWEQHKFSDFTWNAGKRNKDNLDLEAFAITNDRGFIRQNEAHDEFGYMKNTDRRAYNIVEPYSFAYNPARINVGSIGYYEGTEDVIVSSLYEVFKTADYIDDRFLWHWLKSDQFPQWITKLQEGSVRLYFYYDKLCECQMLMPSLDEQKKIATLFDNLDDRIDLHQRQTQKLTELKQGLLQNMFPREGESVPRLRFPGFTTTWKQHKVQDIYKITRGYVLAAPETNKNPSDDMPYPVYSSQTKNNGLMGYYKDYLYEDAITWTTDGANAGTVNYRAGKFYCTNVCGVLLSEEGYANKCAAEALNNVAWRWVSHVGNPKLMNNVMGEIPISLPVSIEEQNQISRFLEEIDNLIGLYERYVTTLIHLKKGLLQKMFPQD
ncbi:MAG: restriction endonuclease subunit S [Aeriscardovia sp.]|nr:restriction endonuclease subunit S [Aeriscardovia sp.]